MSTLSPYQMLAQVREATGHSIYLRPYDEVNKVVVSDDRIAVLIYRYKVTERKHEDVLSGRSLVFMQWTLDPSTGTLVYDEMIVPDSTFVETHHKRFGWPTQAERTAKREWEASCGTPGRGRYPAPIQAERENAYFITSSS